MRVGLDIGSTTIKCVVLDDCGNLVFSDYERHYSHILEKSEELLRRVCGKYVPGGVAKLAISGSAGMGMADSVDVPFVQEVFATRVAANRLAPGTDCIIELGGEDAKILFLTGAMEVRMNGSCAGGTGAFIDQMATLLKLSAEELNEAAHRAEKTYTIASRCGVFAKSDIQPLINQGARTEDIAASIYQAVVNQTIAGLAQGRAIKGNVLYLGGPLTFSDVLRESFDATLGVNGVCPKNSLYFVAMGAAFYSDGEFDLNEVADRMRRRGASANYRSMPPLFKSQADYDEFRARHDRARVARADFPDSYGGRVHIGIDSGSTTVKLAVIDEEGRLLFTDYRPNLGNPVPLIRDALLRILTEHPHLTVGSVTTTGYGEELAQHAFHADFGLVETVAHFTAARHFLTDVDFIIDIGGQDMKCFKIADGAISDIFLNEACSSGCGSFLQTFAQALGYGVEEFARLGLFADRPVDLGSRCTVFMNSSVKQAQKDGATLENISAGLAISVVRNALYKVIRASSPEELGRKIVVQGGTFYNEAVLRAFENEMGVEVIRPDIAGLMGAYGAALYGRAHKAEGSSSLLSAAELESFTQLTRSELCGKCGNNCQLTINTFFDGETYISGNRCDRPVTGRADTGELNLYEYKRRLILSYKPVKGGRGRIGIPLTLNMWELFPFWHTFFTRLGFTVYHSPMSSRSLYLSGQTTIPSDTVCFPAKLAHGHIRSLVNMGVDAIFYPCMTYNLDEHLGDNHYNCPVVAYYAELLHGNMDGLKKIHFLYPYLNINDKRKLVKTLLPTLRELDPSITPAELRRAVDAGFKALEDYQNAVRHQGELALQYARDNHRRIMILAGRPYHIDPEISHGIDKLACSLGFVVVSEDSVCHLAEEPQVRVLNQWTYHARLYRAAAYAAAHPDTELVQLVSFGCGVDAITTDEVRAILEKAGKFYTQIKIDEITNLGAVTIRLRSLLGALEEREEDR